MAERRMFSKTIIDSDMFLDLPMSAQCLYFHLGMRADDDGFVNNPNRIMRIVGASSNDMRDLVSKRLIIPFESGVLVIKHWRIHNGIQKDRYKPTVNVNEMDLLVIGRNKEYYLRSEMDTNCIQDVYGMESQISLDKSSLDKTSPGEDTKTGNQPLSQSEVEEYCHSKGYRINAAKFFNHYEAQGWKLANGLPVKSWKALLAKWQDNNSESNHKDEIPVLPVR